ncbi:uncharacterized protein LOC143180384 [Calliopsis andreniformis]|uniref:uncharacterized protein LOC143180384 n=1 Tax=Calliopsis andreniformis TaxID=337506 RepID=UPI003FCEB20E
MMTGREQRPEKGQYAVICFTEEQGLSEIPQNWLIHNCLCWWPPNNTKNLSTLITKRIVPNTNTWQKIPIKITKLNQTLQNARKIVEDSDCISTDDQKVEEKHRKKISKWQFSTLQSTSYSDTNCKSEDENLDNEYNNNEFSLPSKYKRVNTLETPSCSKRARIYIPEKDIVDIDIANDVVDDPLKFDSNSFNYISFEEGPHSYLEEQISIEEKNVFTEIYPDKQKRKYNENLEKTSEKSDIVLKVLARLERKIDNLTKRLNRIDGRQLPTPIGSVDTIKKVFPLSNMEDVINFEKQLENETVNNELLTFLDRIGGNTPEDNVKNIFNKLFTNEFAKNHTWCGRKNKQAISNLKLIQVVREKIVTQYQGYRETNFHRTASEWFRLGAQRLSRELKKPLIL